MPLTVIAGVALFGLLVSRDDAGATKAFAFVEYSRGNDDPEEPDRETARIRIEADVVETAEAEKLLHLTYRALNTSGSPTFQRSDYLIRTHRNGGGDAAARLSYVSGADGAGRLEARLDLGPVAMLDGQTLRLTVQHAAYVLTDRPLVQQEVWIAVDRDPAGSLEIRIAARQLCPGFRYGRRPMPLRLVANSAGRDLAPGPYPPAPGWGAGCEPRPPLDVLDLSLFGVDEMAIALESGDRARLRELLAEGARDTQGVAATPIHRAVLNGDLASLRRLLASDQPPSGGADRLGFAMEPLALAVYCGDVKAAEALLGFGADVESTLDYAGTPLMIAVMGGDVACARLLVEAGAELHGTLVLAASKGHAELVRVLLAREESPDGARDPFGATALMAAARRGHTEVVRVLLAAGASIAERDEDGNAVLDHAHWGPESRRAETLHLLEIAAKKQGR